MIEKAKRAELENAISNHLDLHGNANWSLVRNRFPEIKEATWWRYVRRIVDKKPASKKQLKTSKQIICQAGKHLPVAPSPATLAKAGSSGARSIDMFARYEELYADAVLLREYALGDDREIENVTAFRASIKHRQDILSGIAKAAQVLWGLRRIQKFYDIIIQAIREVSPEVAAKIIKKLEEADDEYGFTVNAKL